MFREAQGDNNSKGFFALVVVGAFLLFLGAFTAFTQTADAQQRGANDQYEPNPPPPPVVLPDAGNGNGGDVGPDSGAGNAGDNGTGDGDGGSGLPFTGYPVTTLVLIVLALLIAGLALRAGLFASGRLRTSRRTT